MASTTGRTAPMRRLQRSPRRWSSHPRLRLLLVLALVLALLPTWSFLRAVTAAGTDPPSAKAAEWARGHGLGFVVTGAEEVLNYVSSPAKGGLPDPALLRPAGSAPPGRGRSAVAAGLRPTLLPLAGKALPGEGVFRCVVNVRGRPAVELAYLRPDRVHTSYLSAVLVLDQSRVRFVQHPGYAEPGHLGLWSQPDALPAGARTGLAAAFNAGFKLKDSRGGYYADGHTVGTLAPGAASMVITRDGRLSVGTWGRDVQLTPEVVSVRQNLRLLIDHGQIVPSVDANTQSVWGATVRGADYVWRSGVGVTARGDAVYVVGAALSARSLAEVLHRAGAIRAMQLDINQMWVSGFWYSPGNSGPVVPHKVVPFARPADRYFSPSSRDFVAAYAR